jgi:hypothetical protein
VPPSDFAGAGAGLSDFSEAAEDGVSDDFSALSAFFRDSEG